VSDEGGHIGMMIRIVREDIIPLRKRASWVNEALGSAVDAGLVRDRDKRIPSAMALMARLVEAFPEAGSRVSLPSIQHIQPKTDISELAPRSDRGPSTPQMDTGPSTPQVDVDPSAPSVDVDMDGDAPPVTIAEPPRAVMPEAARGLVVPIKLADTGNPATAKPPSSAEPPSSSDDSVAIFVRGEEMPKELLALRQKKKTTGD
jgi:hypothetical protein